MPGRCAPPLLAKRRGIPVDLPGRIPPDQGIAGTPADGACKRRMCHHAIAGQEDAAIIPPHMTGKPWKNVTAGAVAGDVAPGASRHLGHMPRRGWRGCQRRSRAETRMHCMSRRTAQRNGRGGTPHGGSPSAANRWRRDASPSPARLRSFRCPLPCQTAMPRAAIPVAGLAGQVCPRSGAVRPSPDRCNRVHPHRNRPLAFKRFPSPARPSLTPAPPARMKRRNRRRVIAHGDQGKD